MADNFKKTTVVKTPLGRPVTKFRSSKTGLSVVHVENEGPIVNGYFTLATESFDDFGCPHTLEHLIFLGSELYPYKGVLDGLANRALADGTNAWTADDHTAYTIATAGSEGFLNVMPSKDKNSDGSTSVFIDHILYPVITDAAYYTEVHNITGSGEDAGVVYSEMQGRENTSNSLMSLAGKRIMYPEGSGYRYDTGGLMACLRTLSAEKIRQYHRDYYRPDNLCLIISGMVDHDKLLAALAPVEERILSKGPLPPMKRPWVDSPRAPLLSQSSTTVVTFPSDDESTGEVTISWFGPSVTDHMASQALHVLEVYLTDSAVAILQKEMVEIEDPYCASVCFQSQEHIRLEIHLSFESVPAEKLDEVEAKFFSVMNQIVKDGIDMDRMTSVIKREKLKLLDRIENNHMTYAWPCLVQFLYGQKDDHDLEEFMDDLKRYDEVAKFDGATWLKYFKQFFLDSHHVTIVGKPSDEHAKKQAADEEKRVAEQRERLGEAKLAELERNLEKHRAQNDIPVPVEIFDNFPIPNVKDIEMIEVVSGRSANGGAFNNEVQKHLDKDHAEVPYFIEFDHIHSEFVELSLLMLTTDLAPHLRPYLELYFESFYSLPLVDPSTGKEISYEEVVKLLDLDTVDRACFMGLNGSYNQTVTAFLKTERSKYGQVISWLHKMMWHTRFDPERLKVITTKLLNDLPMQKRDGSRMSRECMNELVFDNEKSNTAALGVPRQSNFLPEVLRTLESEPAKVVDALNELRSVLTRPENIRLQVQGNILKQEQPKSAWAKNFGAMPNAAKLNPVPRSSEVRSSSGDKPSKGGFVVSMPSIESSFACHVARGPTNYLDPEYAALRVLAECLHTLEGPFWKQLRGSGAVYGANIPIDVESGFVKFSIYRSPDSLRAFKLAKDIVDKYASGETKFTKQELEGAKASIVYRTVQKEETISKAATEAFVNQVLRNVSAHYNKEFLKMVEAVTVKDMHVVMDKYLLPLFRAETSNVVVTSATNKAQEILSGLNALGFELASKTL
ncbi:hypothetical protein DFQ27_008537 [Actinomortierella ambigua]|uniref:Peptidase M16 C-terminal domain-containing protein n=1 Tax=Actinomortierella ambigua TaxID=1343610 RepID=A0A9P6UBK2_9FUNG|nr:hypothetical protein DFQ27_008537 [Actinomortierella ambigua]